MRSIRTVVVLAWTILTLTALAPAALAASTPHELHLVKDCGMFTGDTPSMCVVSGSDLRAVPIGTQVIYLGPVLANPYFLSSNVLLDAGRGNTATGYCTFDGRATEQRGLCSFWEGTGDLDGFTSILVVTIDDTGLWHLDGMYYGLSAVADPSPSPSPRVASPRPS